MAKATKKSMWTKTFDDRRRASFQIDGQFHLFRHIVEEGGKETFQHEDYRGNIVDYVTAPKQPFEKWLSLQLAAIIREVQS